LRLGSGKLSTSFPSPMPNVSMMNYGNFL
jgi:hypothetical protein